MIDESIMEKIIPIPDEDEEMEKVQGELEDEGFPITNFKKGGIFYHLCRMLVTIYIELKELARVIVNSCFIKHAEGDWLKIKAADYSKQQKEAKAAKGYVTIYRNEYNNALQVTKGHCFKTEPDAGGKELKFYCCENTVIDAGEPVGRVLVEAEAPGTYYNIAPGRITISMIHLDGMDYVTNEEDWLFEEGAEEEDLEDLRDRCMSSWAELATRTIEEKLRNAAKSVPGVLDARIDAQHPRGQGTVDVIVTGAAGEASPELIRRVGEAIEPLKGNYEDYLVKSSEVVRQAFELVVYLAEDAATDGVDAQAVKLIEEMMALTRGEMNTLYRDSIIQVLSTKIDNYRKTDILRPSGDMLLGQDKVIMAGDINVTVRNVAQGTRGRSDAAMIENFIEYMWYLLTTPLKKLKKALNKWYILCKVFGRRFDEAKEDILRARDEGMVATCGHEMLPVHGADRRLTRYEGEHPENYRSRIAMYDELCKLGGTNEGVLLAVKTLGYASPVLVRANELTGFVHFTLDGSWLLDGSRALESDTLENRWAEFYIVIVMDADEEHPISFDIMRKTVRKWKEVGAKDNYFFRYNLSIREIYSSSFLAVLYKKYLYYYDYLKTDGMWELDGSHVLDAQMSPISTRIGYRYESSYGLHEAGLAAMAYIYSCCMAESAILKAAYSFRMHYFDYLKTDGSWMTDGNHMADAELSPRDMRWGTTFRHQHEESLLLKQRYRMQPCKGSHSIRKALERYRMVIHYFDYLKLNGLWKLNGSRLMGAQRSEYTTKQEYRFGVGYTREYRVIWHEEHNLIFLDGTWSLDGSKTIDAWQKTEVL